ncbi:afamin [Octodon degus]|uniref:Afamin n=1 Tax=Octodon degus TaxID=10160 RepID=A0A6P6DP72_OCTDE|nr:afamin [Octodon degus]
MQQLKHAGFIFLLFFLIESLTLPTKPQDVDNINVSRKFIDENLASMAIITFAQYVQEATFDDMEMLIRDVMKYRDKCLEGKTLPECSQLANDMLQEMICSMEGLPQKYNFSHCCSKVDFKRRLCFLYNKKANVGFLPPFPTLDPEEKCEAIKNARDSFLNQYIYEVARRNSFVFAPTLLTVAARFEEVTKTCCEEQQKANCFQAKAIPITQYLKAFSSYQKYVCGALMKFGPKVLNSINIAVFSKKFPNIEFKELTSLLEDVSSMYHGCCAGDVLQCIRDQSQVMSHICSKQDSISSKIKECCEKKIPEREDCIINSNKDDRPMNVSPTEAKFTGSEHMCQERDTDPDDFFARFLYEYSRSHSDLSTPELLRIAGVYKDLLADCCDRETLTDCYHHMEIKFNVTTGKSLQMVQQECEHFQNLGQDGLKYHYFIKLTKIAPQLSTEELISLGNDMVTALITCCTLSDEFACVDDLADLVLGELCGINENRTINPAVDHCCTANFAFRRPCFESLKADKTYVPPPLSQDLSVFPADWCQSQNEELQGKKNRFLIEAVRLRPQLADKELLSVLARFISGVEKCCAVPEPEACFREERQNIG